LDILIASNTHAKILYSCESSFLTKRILSIVTARSLLLGVH